MQLRHSRTRPRRVHAEPVPDSPLLAGALPRVDWSDAYAVRVPGGPVGCPQDWVDAVFQRPPPWLRGLFAARAVVVRLAGIEPGGRHVFDAVARSPHEVLVGTDQRHLAFRASVLLQEDRVVLSTLVQCRNRRGRAYSAVVRRLHAVVVRGLLARAARTMAAAA